jgi:hypothetical protein
MDLTVGIMSAGVGVQYVAEPLKILPVGSFYRFIVLPFYRFTYWLLSDAEGDFV